MGYDLHVTRKDSWADEEGPVIAAEEWLSLVERDPSLFLEPRNGPFYARWSGPSKYDDPWIDWAEGELYTKNPDPPLIAKLLEIATVFQATVRGDDDEIYTSPTEYHHGDMDREQHLARTEVRPITPAAGFPTPTTETNGPPPGKRGFVSRLAAQVRRLF